jgi:hypothetical protein
MRRLLILSLFLAVSLDFSMPDAPLFTGGPRAVEWGDEEESVPSRRERAAGEVRRDRASPAAPRSVERPLTEPRADRRAYADRPNPPAVWLVPIRQALVPSFASASPAEDH